MATGRYLIILFIGWVMASCTKEVVKVIDGPKEIEKSTISIKISLGSDVGTRSGWGYDDYFPSVTPTPEESKVSNVLLIIFKNIYLEEYAMYKSEGTDFTINENIVTLHQSAEGENEIDLEPGVHFFYAILNIPEGLYQEMKPLLENGKYTLTKDAFEKQLMKVDLDYLKGETGNNGFIMTNSTPPTSTVVYSETQLEDLGLTETNVSIPVGRALAKISLAYVPAKTGELHGALEDIKYTVVNHPSQMYLMPVIEDGKLITPHYTTTNIPAGYFMDPIRELSEKEKNGQVSWLVATTEKIGDNADFAYCIENNVKKHLKSTTTGLVIKGKFVPAQWLNKDGTIGTPAADDSFWRIAEIDNDGYLLAYTKGYYNAKPDDALCAAMGPNFVPKEYPNGICYYTFWPSSNDEHQIKRNDFHRIVITYIHGAGAPDIDDTIDPDVDPDPKPTWGRLVVYALGWDDYPQIEEIGEGSEGDSDNDLEVSIPGWEEDDGPQEEDMQGGDNVFK
ncbi:MAG: Mfa1 family fimbria major subunit [Tannerellaceae bacterium]|nr:Mfa1 family fimbria major subunit [Tannerellaceae bacterium]